MRDEDLIPLPEIAQFFHRSLQAKNHSACAKSFDHGQKPSNKTVKLSQSSIMSISQKSHNLAPQSKGVRRDI